MATDRFTGKSAVVTGGASGIGQAVATRLRREGARVSIWDRDEARLDAAKGEIGSGTETVKLDITDYAAVEAAAKQTADALGGIDILVCSAAITGPNALVVDYPIDDWKQVFDINVHGVFFSNRAVVPFMREKKYGRIVNIASVAGKEGNPTASAYSASKAAVIGLTKSLGKELATSGITVNAVTPAAVKTAMFSQMTEAHIQYMLSKIPMGRFGEIDEVASLICWLASDECSFTTASVFDISGGRATY